MGPSGAQRWAHSPAAPTGGRKSPCCRRAGTYVCLEAPAPKLLLLICNPLRAGGKGIRGINGLTVTTTIISSGCLGQAVHTRTGLSALAQTHTSTQTRAHTPLHTHQRLCTRRHTSTHGTEHKHTGTDTGSRTCVHAETCTPLRAHPHGYAGWHTPPLHARAHAHKPCTKKRTPMHAHPAHPAPRVHPYVRTRAPARTPTRTRVHTQIHTCTHASMSRPVRN